jgi:hypothetical protein
MGYHPESARQAQELREKVHSDDWARINKNAEVAQVGDRIKLDLLPAILYITIFKNVQIGALKILCERLHEHISVADTIIQKRKIKKGKTEYVPWLSAVEIKGLTKDALYLKMIGLTENRTKTVRILVKQRVVRGAIHELWRRRYSLL